MRVFMIRTEQERKSGWAVTLASEGGHDHCVKLLQEARWPSLSSVSSGKMHRQPSLEEDYGPNLAVAEENPSRGESRRGGQKVVGTQDSRAEGGKEEPVVWCKVSLGVRE